MSDLTGPWWAWFFVGLFWVFIWLSGKVQWVVEEFIRMRKQLERLEHDAENRTH